MKETRAFRYFVLFKLSAIGSSVSCSTNPENIPHQIIFFSSEILALIFLIVWLFFSEEDNA